MLQTHAFMLLLSLGLCSARATKDACDPECIKADTFIADPYSCNGYYYCISPGTPSGPYTCSNDKIFDANANPNHETPVEPCKANAACNPACVIPECQIVCRAAFEVIINPIDCGKFSVCIPGDGDTFIAHEDDCPADRPYFNGADCTSHQDGCCNVCDPDCSGIEYGVQIPDPDDCHKYYTCLGDGSDPNIDGPVECIGNGHFDIEQGRCAQGSNCTNLCGDPTIAPPTGPVTVPTGTVTVPTEPPTEPTTTTP